jgi:hypothetical protein
MAEQTSWKNESVDGEVSPAQHTTQMAWLAWAFLGVLCVMGLAIYFAIPNV